MLQMQRKDSRDRIGNYIVKKVIAEGGFSKVKLAEHCLTGVKVAIKILLKDRINKDKKKNVLKRIRREIDILKMLRHPHVVQLYEVIEEEDRIFLILEYLEGGDLFDYIVSKKRFTEDEARNAFHQLIFGIEYLHIKGIAHRDLKPENLLLTFDKKVKITDFGLSNIMKTGQFLSSSVGSAQYAEVTRGIRYKGTQIDIWSTGVILYAMLAGDLPFFEETFMLLFERIQNGSYSIPVYFSKNVKDLIKKILVVNPRKRITISGIKSHPWFKMNIPKYLSVSTTNGKTIDNVILSDAMDCCDYNEGKETAKKEVLYESTSTLSVCYHLLKDQKKKNKFITTKRIKEDMNNDKYGKLKKFKSDKIKKEKSLDKDTWIVNLEPGLVQNEIMDCIYESLIYSKIKWKVLEEYKLICKFCVNKDYVFFALHLSKQKFESNVFSYAIDVQLSEGNVFLFFDRMTMLKAKLKLGLPIMDDSSYL